MIKLNIKFLLITLLATSFILRIARIDYPKDFIFDEVYYAFTAQEYLKGNPDAWGWWATAPEGRAIAWVNPPLPQEIMALSMFIFNTQESWSWRLPGAILGVLSIYLVFMISKILFKHDRIALISAFIFSLDGLNFVQSRVGMLDIYLITFILFSLYFLLKNYYFLSAFFLGLAISSKWTGVCVLILFAIILIKNQRILKILYFIIIPVIVYLFIYFPFFLTGHNIDQFIELIKQEIWYHTNLKATHDYASPWWSWPLNLYPVWYFAGYIDGNISNIFASGNPLFFLFGILAILKTSWDFLKQKRINLGIILMGYFVFWLPWAFSPRVMFLYYYSPSIPFLSIALSYQLNQILQQKKYSLFSAVISFIIIGFLLMYPFLVGIPLPKDIVRMFFYTNLTKNPFD